MTGSCKGPIVTLKICMWMHISPRNCLRTYKAQHAPCYHYQYTEEQAQRILGNNEIETLCCSGDLHVIERFVYIKMWVPLACQKIDLSSVAASARIDKEAAKRFVKSALWGLSGNVMLIILSQSSARIKQPLCLNFIVWQSCSWLIHTFDNWGPKKT